VLTYARTLQVTLPLHVFLAKGTAHRFVKVYIYTFTYVPTVLHNPLLLLNLLSYFQYFKAKELHNGPVDSLLMRHHPDKHQKDSCHLHILGHIFHEVIPLCLRLHLQHMVHLHLNKVFIYSLLLFVRHIICSSNFCMNVVVGASLSSNATPSATPTASGHSQRTSIPGHRPIGRSSSMHGRTGVCYYVYSIGVYPANSFV
jgi:hypothetical protein